MPTARDARVSRSGVRRREPQDSGQVLPEAPGAPGRERGEGFGPGGASGHGHGGCSRRAGRGGQLRLPAPVGARRGVAPGQHAADWKGGEAPASCTDADSGLRPVSRCQFGWCSTEGEQ
jgi:hypothetical protein